MESPIEPTVDIGARVFKIGVVRAAFNHAYHVLAGMLLSKEPPTGSLLCPHLIRRDHDVVARRYQLLKAQPAPLLGPVGRPDSDDEDGPAKRQKTSMEELEFVDALAELGAQLADEGGEGGSETEGEQEQEGDVQDAAEVGTEDPMADVVDFLAAARAVGLEEGLMEDGEGEEGAPAEGPVEISMAGEAEDEETLESLLAEQQLLQQQLELLEAGEAAAEGLRRGR